MRKRIHDSRKYTNLKEMLNVTGKMFGNNPAYMFKTDVKDKFRTISHSEFREEINSLGTKLIDMGLEGKRIAVISENRYEWCTAYFSIVAGTGVVVPLDKSLPNNEIENLINRANVEAIFYSDKYDEIMNTFKNNGNTNIKYFISMDINEEKDGIYSQRQLIEEGKKLLENNNRKFLDAKIDANSMGIMLFTSGTTAMSKAVMLSHNNLCSNLYDISSVIKLTEKDRFLSFLPLHHTFESTVGFIYPISTGGTIAFCDGIRHIGDNIKEYKITAMVSVPILYESMYKKVMKGIEKKGKLPKVKKAMKISKILLKFKIDIRKKVFKEIHDNLGGKLRLFVSGGAALDVETRIGFEDLGVKMYQGYGLTESSPVIASEDDKYIKAGSIGKAYPSVEVKIIDKNEQGEGELLARGPSIMLGYYENEEATKETIDEEGFLHTGDLAKIDKDGYIFICGRKKSVIVLKNGKNIFPEELESSLNKIDCIKESFVYGKLEKDGDYKLCAKIVYDTEVVIEKYNETDNEKLKELIMKEVKINNKLVQPYKYIRDIVVTDKELIKTTTQKIKRNEEIKTVESL